MGERFKSKLQQLDRLKEILLANPQGLQKAEIARRLDVHRSTVSDYIDDLGDLVTVYEPIPGHYAIERQSYKVEVLLTLHESVALHLASRLLATRTDKHYPHAAKALRALGTALEKIAPMVSNHLRLSADVLDAGDRRRDPIFMQALEKLTEAWATGQKVSLTHEMENGRVFDYVFAPYYIEPYAVGRTVHVIGLREPINKIRTFKIERIRTIEILQGEGNGYQIPDDFDPRRELKNAWGIWYTEQEPLEVALRFSRQVAGRVQETTWHHTEQVRELADGSLEWRAVVDEWREMLPWVRGWGADVVVLEPEEMREEVKSHINRAARKYDISIGGTDPNARLLQLWGKTTKNADVYHPALYHMLDVAHIAQQLLSPHATPRWRQVLAQMLGTEASTLYEWLPWFIALHDIGKISVPFQAQNEEQRVRLEGEGFGFGRYAHDHKKLHHTLVGRHTLGEWAKQFPYFWQLAFLDMVSGHHGEYQTMESNKKGLWKTLEEPREWEQLRQQAIQLLRHCLLLNEPPNWPNPKNVSAAIAALNGFAILCDWLGSDEDYFSPQPFMSLFEYLSHSRRQARARVGEAGFFVPAVSHAPTSFSGLFQWQPRPLQQAIDDIPQHLLAAPSLTIIEAPTGEGKTEAALTLAHRIGQARGTDEMYVALPTTATSNAMYERLQEHLEVRLGLPATLVKLVHGQDFLVEDDLRITPLQNNDDESHPALTWFAPKKKALLAPFGVGTVDQVELAALNVRHNALRLIGLAGKVVILDEVHAYDTYMNTIIERMLRWLAELGTPVILLSATLPTARRRSLTAAFMGEENVDNTVELEMSEEYPYLLTISALGYYETNPPEQAARQVHLHTLHFNEEEWAGKARWLVDQVSDGGCVCWITNTVERAQRIFQQVKALAPQDVDCTLFHARFPLEERHRIEGEILAKFGKGENGRPQKSIVVGTQVLEQSLDIDFDLMVSDLAPIDLMLQRIGRLHRHERSNRAAAFPEAHVYINCALNPTGQLLMGADRFYMPYILHKSWEQIAEKASAEGMINLPQDYRPLVEAVYDETPPPENSALRELWDEMQRRESKLQGEARIRLAAEPDPMEPFWWNDKKDFHEDEDSNDWAVAQTRYQDRKTITVIPLEKVSEEIGRLYPTSETVLLNQPAGREMQLRLLQRSVRLSHPVVVQALSEGSENRPALFTQSPLLKRCYPLWLVDGFVQIENIRVQLDPELGVLIQKEGA